MVRRIFVAYLLSPMAAPILFAVLPTLEGIYEPKGMLIFAAFSALFSYPVTVVVGFPVLHFFVKKGERRWWVYGGVGLAIGIVSALFLGPLGGFAAIGGGVNALAFWAIGVRANPALNTDAVRPQRAG